VPTTVSRIDPYVVAGGGVANVTHKVDFNPIIFNVPGLGNLSPSIFPPITEPLTSSTTSLVLTLGGGVGIRVTGGLWIEGDLRMFRVMGSDDENAGRFGIGARYRF
jgi:opacity protein-like surface antigen